MSKTSFSLIIASLLLLSIGIMMVFNTTSAEVLDKSINQSTYTALIKQIIYGLLGIACGFVIWKINYINLIRLSPVILFCLIILLVVVFIPKIGQEINGAHRWINVFGLSFQPSEFAKYLIPIYFIYAITKNNFHEKITFLPFLKILLTLAIPLGLILMEPDNGTTAIILVTLAVLFILTKINLKYWALPLLGVLLLGGVIAYNMPHVPDRIRIYLNPELDIKGKGHQPYQAKIAAGSGKVLGRGLGNSLQKLNYLPEARSDYIAAIYAEEFGFVGISFLIILYMLIAFCGFQIAASALDIYGFYLASIMTFLISFQAFLNLGVVSGLLPSKGITLPFFSQGGTSLLINIIALSILLSVAKKTKCKA